MRLSLPIQLPCYTAAAFLAVTFGSIASANAHVGHLGELAGHAHVAGVALAGIAAVLGAALIARGRAEAQDASTDTDTGAEQDAEGEPANG